LEELIQLKVFYGASIMSIMMRARDLDLISEATHRKFWMECGCKWRQQHKEPGDEKFQINEAPVRFKMLVLRAAAEGVISFSKGAGLLKMPLGRIREELQQVCT
jgi:Zn-dependent peptidase ImmA (M78 family)